MEKHQYGMADLFRSLLANQGSDLHLSAGSPPRIRIHGVLRPLNLPSLTPDEVKQLVYSVLAPEQTVRLELEKELNTARGLSGIGRFRVNAFYQRSSVGAVFRNIPHTVPGFKELHLPVPFFEHICSLSKGLVLLAGPSGSGKSTTMAAIIDFINSRDECHIVSVEEPIEFLHRNKRSLVNQREVGHDSHTFPLALQNALRQDPDIIAIADIRDKETLLEALSLGEKGHLVIASLAAADAVQALHHVLAMFLPEQRESILDRLAASLEIVVAQQLVMRIDEEGLYPALEILVATGTVQAILRDDKVNQLYAAMQTGVRDGMSTMNNALAHLVSVDRVTKESALEHTTRPDEMKELLEQLDIQQDGRNKRNDTRIW